MLEFTHIADSSATTEIRNLFPTAPLLRPADIFTSAARQGRLAALGIGICSPDASGAGLDCTATMYENKIRRYAEHLKQDNGFDYIPLIFSCYGRVHPECQNILKSLAQRAARRRGVIDFQGLLSRVHRNIGVEIWRRLASMIHSCAPRLTDEESKLLLDLESGGGDPCLN